MKKLIPLQALLCFSAAFAQDQLITIYNEKNRFHDKLLEEYYQDLEVKKILANYNHQIVEATTERGKELIANITLKSTTHFHMSIYWIPSRRF